MLPVLSFGWTVHALVAKRKCVTRRDMADRTARMWRRVIDQGGYAQAWSKVPHAGGQPVGIIRPTGLSRDPLFEDRDRIPDEDWAREGFRFYQERPDLAPEEPPFGMANYSFEEFEKWRDTYQRPLVRLQFEWVCPIWTPKYRDLVIDVAFKPGVELHHECDGWNAGPARCQLCGDEWTAVYCSHVTRGLQCGRCGRSTGMLV